MIFFSFVLTFIWLPLLLNLAILGAYLNRKEPAMLALSLFVSFILITGRYLYIEDVMVYKIRILGELIIISYCCLSRTDAAKTVGILSLLGIAMHTLSLFEFNTSLSFIYNLYVFNMTCIEYGQLVCIILMSQPIINRIKGSKWARSLVCL